MSSLTVTREQIEQYLITGQAAFVPDEEATNETTAVLQNPKQWLAQIKTETNPEYRAFFYARARKQLEGSVRQEDIMQLERLIWKEATASRAAAKRAKSFTDQVLWTIHAAKLWGGKTNIANCSDNSYRAADDWLKVIDLLLKQGADAPPLLQDGQDNEFLALMSLENAARSIYNGNESEKERKEDCGWNCRDEQVISLIDQLGKLCLDPKCTTIPHYELVGRVYRLKLQVYYNSGKMIDFTRIKSVMYHGHIHCIQEYMKIGSISLDSDSLIKVAEHFRFAALCEESETLGEAAELLKKAAIVAEEYRRAHNLLMSESFETETEEEKKAFSVLHTYSEIQRMLKTRGAKASFKHYTLTCTGDLVATKFPL